MDTFLASITMPDDILKWALEQLTIAKERDFSILQEQQEAQRSALAHNETARKRLMDLRLRDLIDDGEFLERKTELAQEGERLRHLLTSSR